MAAPDVPLARDSGGDRTEDSGADSGGDRTGDSGADSGADRTEGKAAQPGRIAELFEAEADADADVDDRLCSIWSLLRLAAETRHEARDPRARASCTRTSRMRRMTR